MPSSSGEGAKAHFQRLERLYHAARCNAHFQPRLTVEARRAVVVLPVGPHLYHAMDAVHGSNFFKVLDDAAFFAANSLEEDQFLVTANFHLDFLRPVTEGEIRAEGRVTHAGRARILAEAIATDAEGREVARGGGAFMRSGIPLPPLED